MNTTHDFLFKILFLGDSGVGKSSLLLKLTEKKFQNSILHTIGLDFKMKTFEVNKKKIHLQIWDSAGQERFRSITSSYYHLTDGIFLVYDITDRDSFNNIENWLNQIQNKTKNNCFKFLLGNKRDLNAKRKVSYGEASNFAEKHSMMFSECSAIEIFENINEIFEKMASELEKNAEKDIKSGNRNNNYFANHNAAANLNKKNNKENKERCC